FLRLRKNKAAVTSAIVLVLMALIGIFSPLLSPHPYDKIYPQFVRVAPSPEAYPRADTITPGLEQVLARARLKSARQPEPTGNQLVLNVTAQRPTDERVLRYFQRSDLFSNPKIELAPDGLSGKLTMNVSRNYFLLGTDNLGRDLMTRIFIGVRM
ncbi:hypothetical protein J3336_11645, partial [Leuconostoc mesenteroides]|nr:hypothetical protein [Leuconostoc mesenteroides]